MQEFLDRVMAAPDARCADRGHRGGRSTNSTYQQGINWQRLQGAGNTGLSLTMQPTGPNTLPGGAVPSAAGAGCQRRHQRYQQPGSHHPGLLQIGYVNPTSRLGNIASAITLLESFGNVRVLSSPSFSVLKQPDRHSQGRQQPVLFHHRRDHHTVRWHADGHHLYVHAQHGGGGVS